MCVGIVRPQFDGPAEMEQDGLDIRALLAEQQAKRIVSFGKVRAHSDRLPQFIDGIGEVTLTEELQPVVEVRLGLGRSRSLRQHAEQGQYPEDEARQSHGNSRQIQKMIQPPMNADERRSKIGKLSAFIGGPISLTDL
jgi:hypothetical protein